VDGYPPFEDLVRRQPQLPVTDREAMLVEPVSTV
jgi:hypothetical protein